MVELYRSGIAWDETDSVLNRGVDSTIQRFTVNRVKLSMPRYLPLVARSLRTTRWTPEEDARVAELYRNGTPFADINKTLNRIPAVRREALTNYEEADW